MAKRNDSNIQVIRLNLLDGPKLIKKQVGISWTVFIISVVLILVMVIAPVVTLRIVNKSLAERVKSLNETYASLKKKESEFANVIKQKNTIVRFMDTAYLLVDNQPKLSIVLDEIRKRLPKGTAIQGGINLTVKGESVFLSLQVTSDQYIDAPTLLDSFGNSPYLYVKDAKIVPLNVSSISQSQEKRWSYNVNLVLGWKQVVREGDDK